MHTTESAEHGAAPDVRRDVAIIVRVTRAEREELRRLARAAGVSVSEYIRSSALVRGPRQTRAVYVATSPMSRCNRLGIALRAELEARGVPVVGRGKLWDREHAHIDQAAAFVAVDPHEHDAVEWYELGVAVGSGRLIAYIGSPPTFVPVAMSSWVPEQLAEQLAEALDAPR